MTGFPGYPEKKYSGLDAQTDALLHLLDVVDLCPQDAMFGRARGCFEEKEFLARR